MELTTTTTTRDSTITTNIPSESATAVTTTTTTATTPKITLTPTTDVVSAADSTSMETNTVTEYTEGMSSMTTINDTDPTPEGVSSNVSNSMVDTSTVYTAPTVGAGQVQLTTFHNSQKLTIRVFNPRGVGDVELELQPVPDGVDRDDWETMWRKLYSKHINACRSCMKRAMP